MENRNHKDSLFIDLFCKDQKSGKENFISLYNALHQSKLDLAHTELKEVKNDSPYIPTTTITRNPSGGGEMNEDINVLQSLRKKWDFL